MRNKNSGTWAIIAVAAVAVLFFVFLLVPGLAAEEPPVVSIQSHPVEEEECVILNQSGVVDSFPAQKIQVIEAENADGNILYHCKVKDVPNDSGEKIQFDNESTDLKCILKDFDIVTENWSEVITTSGEGTLTCRANPSG